MAPRALEPGFRRRGRHVGYYEPAGARSYTGGWRHRQKGRRLIRRYIACGHTFTVVTARRFPTRFSCCFCRDNFVSDRRIRVF
jgi:hypothetical protein